MTERILNGDIDFAYVDAFSRDRRVSTDKVAEELHDLCGTPRYLKNKSKPSNRKSFYESLDYIAYLDGNPVLNFWFNHHLKQMLPDLNIRAFGESPRSVLNFILADLGVGVLPRHTVAQAQKSGKKLTVINGCGKDLRSEIYVAYLQGRSQTRAALALSKFIAAELQ